MPNCVECGEPFTQTGGGRPRFKCYTCSPARPGQDWRKYQDRPAPPPQALTGPGIRSVVTGDSNVTHLAWDPETHDMTVSFASGNVYRFFGVAKKFFTELCNASDLSRFLRRTIMVRFPYEKVE